MTPYLSRLLLLAGAFLAVASLPARAQVTLVTDGSNSSTTCNSFTLAAGGSVTLTPTGCLNLTAPPPPPPVVTRLVNISTRMQVLTGNDVLIGGLTISGSAPKTIVVRARGPSLASAGVANPLANPMLQLFSGQNQIAVNDDWNAATNAAAVLASGFAPPDPQEAAILMTLNPGAYTAIVTGAGGTTGVGLIEVFEVERPDIPLANLAARGQVRPGDDAMIGGFVIQGSSAQTVVIRARGPSLASSGVTGTLANPQLQLFSGASQIASNDDWGTAPNAAAITASGYAPGDPLESVILISLNPGAYTAVVTGVGGATGIGLVEIFAIP